MEIVLALDTYEDIFSDFDIRDFNERAFSIDFLDELRVRARKPTEDERLSIVLLVPAMDRKPEDESLILERMRSFFSDRSAVYSRRARKSRLTSFLHIAIGLAFLLAGNLLAERLALPSLFGDFLLIPAWFFVWSGLDQLIHGREEILLKEKYYARLCDARTMFKDREAY